MNAIISSAWVNIVSNRLSFCTIGIKILFICLIALGIISKGPPNLSINVFRVSNESENPLIIFTGIPTPGGTDVGIGSALMIVTPTFTPVIIPPRVSANCSIVVRGAVMVDNAPWSAFF